MSISPIFISVSPGGHQFYGIDLLIQHRGKDRHDCIASGQRGATAKDQCADRLNAEVLWQLLTIGLAAVAALTVLSPILKS